MKGTLFLLAYIGFVAIVVSLVILTVLLREGNF